MRLLARITIQRTIMLAAAFAALVGAAPARADDCSTLIEGLVTYLQAPKAANECPATYHAVLAFVTTSHVDVAQTPGIPTRSLITTPKGQTYVNVPSEPLITEVGTVGAAMSSSPDTFMHIVLQKIKTGMTPRPPELPYQLLSDPLHHYHNGVYCDHASTGCVPFSLDPDDIRVHVVEGQAGAPSKVEILSISGGIVQSAAPICKGSLMTGFFDPSTAFTILLVKSRSGSCAI